jgi:hypothetical protein
VGLDWRRCWCCWSAGHPGLSGLILWRRSREGESENKGTNLRTRDLEKASTLDKFCKTYGVRGGRAERNKKKHFVNSVLHKGTRK